MPYIQVNLDEEESKMLERAKHWYGLNRKSETIKKIIKEIEGFYIKESRRWETKDKEIGFLSISIEELEYLIKNMNKEQKKLYNQLKIKREINKKQKFLSRIINKSGLFDDWALDNQDNPTSRDLIIGKEKE